ncbi:hypothetical protein SAMN04488523_11366 [Sulfitobacter brevis]|uniref:Uncharacterized protein n=1 Tax=Sulfitobacter brevis TaxID=74348 RepID=A0A1I2EU28_9RHOB|nr:DUF6880 family protein [Sulfitobacter brevis]SFE96345.1 hypothetical protein SAMN04488523_11366 [Sulfitobacter brevis]
MSKKTLNHSNLEALGAEQLAALLMEVSTGSADIKRRLRLELSHRLGAAELAHDVRKRLASIRKSTSFVGWRKRKALIKDLSTQVAMIVEKIAPDDPTLAVDLLWQFTEIAPSVYGRVDDSKGDVGDVFRAAIMQLEHIAPRAQLEPEALADRVWGALQDNAHGEWDGIISLLGPSLGTIGLARLTAHIETYAAPPRKGGSQDHEAIKFLRELRGGSRYAAERKARMVKSWLQEIATAAGDTTAYILQYSDAELKRKDIAAEVAFLLLEQSRAEEALTLLSNAQQDQRAVGQEAWDAAYIACLDALGRTQDAQTHRWACFLATLNQTHLRDHLKGLADFDDVEAEDRAKKHVLQFADVASALSFCLGWPDLLTAAQLIEARANEFDGQDEALLTSAAEVLRTRQPLAAVILLRSMIDFALGQGRSSRYDRAADHLADCAILDAEITDYRSFPTHARYLELLRAKFDRKSTFWAKVR